MKCQFCKASIPDDSVFCPECGKRQEKSQSPDKVFCPGCKSRIEPGSIFCPECGTRIEEVSETPKADTQPDINLQIPPRPDMNSWNNPSQEGPKNTQSVQTPKGKGHVIILIFLLIAGIIIALIVYAVKTLIFGGASESQETLSPGQIEDYLEDDSEAPDSEALENSEEADLSDVDYNLMENADLTMQGMVKTAKNGGKVLQWKKELTFYGQNESGDRILMENTVNAYIDTSILPEGFLDTVSANNEISIKGTLRFSGNDMYISPIYVYDSDGNDMVAAFLDAKAKAAAKSNAAANSDSDKSSASDYILPQSSSRLLNKSDVSGLSLREINYAKNEIYARHGRLFKSDELQNYFNSKSWYNGTINPDSFSASLLSDVEKKNAEYLREIEFDMAPDGYQLDAR